MKSDSVDDFYSVDRLNLLSPFQNDTHFRSIFFNTFSILFRSISFIHLAAAELVSTSTPTSAPALVSDPPLLIIVFVSLLMFLPVYIC